MGEMEPTPETLGKIVEGVPAEEIVEENRTLECPWCDSGEVEKVAEFGSHLMVSQYICGECRSPFEVIRR